MISRFKLAVPALICAVAGAGAISLPGDGYAQTGNSTQASQKAIVGSWNWVAGQRIVLNADGSGIWYQGADRINEGRWKLIDPAARRYRFVLNRGGYVDTVVLSPDGNTLDGRNNEGYVLHGTRIDGPRASPPAVPSVTYSPAAAIVGSWNWVAGQRIVLDADGSGIWYQGAEQINEGRWELIDPAARRYRFVLNRGGYVDTVVLSPDGATLDGRNNEGYVLHGTRIDGPRASPPAPSSPALAIVGTWNWVAGQRIVLNADGNGIWYQGADQINEGRWVLLDPAARRYRFVLRRGGYVDTVVLSPDGNALDGVNNQGYPLHGSRVAGR